MKKMVETWNRQEINMRMKCVDVVDVSRKITLDVIPVLPIFHTNYI